MITKEIKYNLHYDEETLLMMYVALLHTNTLLKKEVDLKAKTLWKKAYIAFTPLNPTFFEGVYFFFLFLLKDIDCGYSLEPLP